MVEAGGQVVLRRHPCNQWSRLEIVWPKRHDRPWGCGRGVGLDWRRDRKSLQTMGRSRVLSVFTKQAMKSLRVGATPFILKRCVCSGCSASSKSLLSPASGIFSMLYSVSQGSDNSWAVVLDTSTTCTLHIYSIIQFLWIHMSHITPYTSTLHKATRIWLKQKFSIYHILVINLSAKGFPLSLGQWPLAL